MTITAIELLAHGVARFPLSFARHRKRLARPYWSLSPQDLEGSNDVVYGLLRGQFEVLQRLNPNR